MERNGAEIAEGLTETVLYQRKQERCGPLDQ
jgi:hypothetical protein